MADIELVIKMPEELYYLVQNKLDFNGDLDNQKIKTIMLAIDNGTPLPKGHGRLIDEDALINYLNRDFLTFERELCYDVEPANALAETFDIIKDAPTIIEADKAESEEV